MAHSKQPKVSPAPRSPRVDLGTVIGLLLAAASIVLGLLLEGGSLLDILKDTAAVIVLGGTLGAVLVHTPWNVAKGAAKRIKCVLFEPAVPLPEMLEELMRLSVKARRTGLVSLEGDIDAIAEPQLKRALQLAVDGTDVQELRQTMDLHTDLEEHRAEEEARVLESAGGYAPTVGILGAVLGLIQVMKKLENMDQVGHGIAVAFVATVYGVAAANLLFLPMASKLKARIAEERLSREMVVEGVVGILDGLNPKLLRGKLEAYIPEQLRSAASNENRNCAHAA